MKPVDPAADLDRALALLGLPPGAGDADLRAAYLEQVRLHPPDRDPEHFERVRDAYDLLRDPAARARLVLQGPDPAAPLASLETQTHKTRCYVGTKLWTDVLKEKRS